MISRPSPETSSSPKITDHRSSNKPKIHTARKRYTEISGQVPILLKVAQWASRIDDSVWVKMSYRRAAGLAPHPFTHHHCRTRASKNVRDEKCTICTDLSLLLAAYHNAVKSVRAVENGAGRAMTAQKSLSDCFIRQQVNRNPFHVGSSAA